MPKDKPIDKSTENDKDSEDYVKSTILHAQRMADILLLAQYYRERYEAMIQVGFTPVEALEILKARGLSI